MRLQNPFNLLAMTITDLRADLLQQIEQADEKLLRIVSSVLEAVKVEYVQETTEEEAEAYYAQHLKPMTHEEMASELQQGMADYERGDYITLEEMKKESATW